MVKFKLEVGVTDIELLAIAEGSRRQSDADLMVANTLEGMQDWAYLGAGIGDYQRVDRNELADRLIDNVVRLSRITSRSSAHFIRSKSIIRSLPGDLREQTATGK